MLAGLIGLFGFLYVFKHIKDALLFAYNYAFGGKRDLGALYGRGSYALITGGSEGMGREFAKAFARRGFGVILVARNPAKLEEAKSEIEREIPGAKVLICVFDFSKIDEAEKSDFDFAKMFKLDLEGLDVSVLLNNVGLGRNGYFEEYSIEELQNFIKVNCVTQTLLSAYFLRRFARRTSRSAILSLSSQSATQRMPFYDIYGASKRYNLHFDQAMRGYYPRVDNYSFTPGHVRTAMTRFKPGFFRISAEEAVDGAMRNFGGQRGVFSGHWKHELKGLQRFVPECAIQALMRLLPEQFNKPRAKPSS